MSKFVTYPAVTVLDNDHSLLIDDPNAGTNSITAENAGNTLLSKWAGFETFDEAVQNTISNNQEFIDRDTAIRSEITELKKKIATTFPSKEASGAVATFESEFEDAPLKSCIVRVEPVQDLHGYDSPWPAGGGKNLFDKDNVNVLNAYIADDKVTTNPTHRSVYIPCKPNTTYTVQKICVGSGYQDRFSIGYTVETPSNGAACYGIIHSTGASRVQGQMVSLSITTGQDAKYLICWVSYSTGYADSIATFQLELGSTATAWTPYSNECPITGWTGCEVQRTGKNLFDKSNTANILNNADMSGDTISIGSQRCVVFIPCKPNQTYIASRKAVLTNDRFMIGYTTTHPAFGVAFKNATRAPYAQTIGNPMLLSVTTGSDAKYVIVWAYWDNKIEALDDLQIELCSIATDYEPYQGETYPITFPTEAGTVYGAYVDVTGGELVVDRAMVDLGTLSWSTTSNNRAFIDNFTTAYGCALPQNAYNVAGCIAEQYKEVPASGSLNIGTFAILQVKALFFYYDGTNLPTGKMVFPLANPIHYPLTPTEITSLLGQNNIWANTGNTAVEYLMSDVSWYVEKKLRAFQSVLAGVEDSTSASKNYSANTYLIFNNDIYRVTKAITTGETIEEGVNVTKTTVAEQLMALAQA